MIERRTHPARAESVKRAAGESGIRRERHHGQGAGRRCRESLQHLYATTQQAVKEFQAEEEENGVRRICRETLKNFTTRLDTLTPKTGIHAAEVLLNRNFARERALASPVLFKGAVESGLAWTSEGAEFSRESSKGGVAMERATAPSWYGGLLLVVVIVIGSASAALPHESRAHSARTENRIAQQFGTVIVQTSINDPGHLLAVADVRALRDKGLGYDDITTLILLYANQSGSPFRSFENILALKRPQNGGEDGRSWNQVAKLMGFKSLGALKRELGQTGGNRGDGDRSRDDGDREKGDKKSPAHSARAENRIAQQFGTVIVQTSVNDPGHLLTVADVRALRDKGLSYGDITTLIQLYANQSGAPFRSFDGILALKQTQNARKDGRSWNQVAKIMGFESLRALKKELGQTAGNQKPGKRDPDRVAKLEKKPGKRDPDRLGKVEKKPGKRGPDQVGKVEKKPEGRGPDRIAKVEKKPERQGPDRITKVEKKPERPERIERVQRPERVERVQKPERPERPARPERLVRVPRPESPERLERAQKPEREQLERVTSR